MHLIRAGGFAKVYTHKNKTSTDTKSTTTKKVKVVFEYLIRRGGEREVTCRTRCNDYSIDHKEHSHCA
jgi:hypothetical protein